MGLDVALAIVILIAGLRGWLQGFAYQVIRIGGLIACVYLAVPAREQVKPYIRPYLPALRPELLDRLLWWVAAVAGYAVIVGGLSLALRMTKRPEIPGMPPQRSRNNQFAGLLLGLAKGALVAAFVVAALQKYAMSQIEQIPWAREQAKSSLSMAWNREYHPASRIWTSGPVRHFVNHVQRMGLPHSSDPTPSQAVDQTPDRPVVETARKSVEDAARRVAPGEASRGAPPAPPAAGPAGSEVADPVVRRAVEDARAAIDALSTPK